MSSIALQPVQRLAQCSVEPLLGGISIAGLATLRDPNHEAMALVDVECPGRPDPSDDDRIGRRIACPTSVVIQAPRFFQTLVACDGCRALAAKEARWGACKLYWEAICPASFRETDKQHAGFPKSQYEATKDYLGHESLLLFGPPRKGKSRLGMVLLKRCLVRANLHVGVMWEEDMEESKGSFGDRKALVAKWGRYDVLLMDDALLSGARHENSTSFLKQLLDYMIRHKRRFIITSQVGGADYKDAATKDGTIKKQDEARIDALLERVRESCRVVSFADAKPAADEQAF